MTTGLAAIVPQASRIRRLLDGSSGNGLDPLDPLDPVKCMPLIKDAASRASRLEDRQAAARSTAH